MILRFGDAFKFTLLHIDFALITLWFIVTAAQFKHDELLLYPLALYFTGMFFWRKDATWPIFQRGFLLLLLPAWWICSSLWSPEPMLAFRSGVQSLLTILICMFIAARLTTRQFMVVILAAMTVLAIRCMPQSMLDFSLGKPSKAIYSHKNSLGIAMSVLFIVATAVLLTVGASWRVKLLGLCAAPLALFLVFASQSATAILLSIGMLGIVAGALLYLGKRNQVTLGRMLIFAATIMAAAVAAIAALNFMETDPIDLVLGALGKDRSLTGRTDLWSLGAAQMKEHPFFGVGAGGFWRYSESADVRQIFFEYHKTYRSTFYFHNSWLEIGVAFGWIGVAMTTAALGWALATLMRRAIFFGGPEHWALLAIGVSILVRTLVESDLFGAFNMLHMMLWTSVLIQPQQPAALSTVRPAGSIRRQPGPKQRTI